MLDAGDVLLLLLLVSGVAADGAAALAATAGALETCDGDARGCCSVSTGAAKPAEARIATERAAENLILAVGA